MSREGVEARACNWGGMPQVCFLWGGVHEDISRGGTSRGGRQSKHLENEILKVFESLLNDRGTGKLLACQQQSQVMLAFTSSSSVQHSEICLRHKFSSEADTVQGCYVY